MRYSSSARAAVSDVHSLLAAVGSAKEALPFARRSYVFRQGDRASHVYYLRHGNVKLCASSPAGKEGVLAVLGPGDFFGEGGLLYRRVRSSSALCLSPCEIIRIPREAVLAACRRSPGIGEALLRHVLQRSALYEDALLHQLFNNSERRLAHVLLTLAGLNGESKGRRDGTIRHISQATLAEMVGTTRPRINGFMNKFRRLGHIDYDEVRVRVFPSLSQLLTEEEAELSGRNGH